MNMQTKSPPDPATPPIPLTLGGMQGAPRRQAGSSARSVFLLPLVLALLAIAAFPVLAHAAGIPQYELGENETEIHRETVKPKSGEKETSPTKTESHKKAHASEAETGGTGPSEEEESESSKTGGTGGGGGSEGKGPSGGEPSKTGGHKTGGGAKAEGSVAEGQKVANEASEATPAPVATQTDSGGGSSPVVPILIAVIVLAAISIGVVVYRQRKGGSGQDGRLPSSNAS